MDKSWKHFLDASLDELDVISEKILNEFNDVLSRTIRSFLKELAKLKESIFFSN